MSRPEKCRVAAASAVLETAFFAGPWNPGEREDLQWGLVFFELRLKTGAPGGLR